MDLGYHSFIIWCDGVVYIYINCFFGGVQSAKHSFGASETSDVVGTKRY